MDSALSGLSLKFLERVPGNRLIQTSLPNLWLYHPGTPTQPTAYLQSPGVCVVLHGEKEIRLGGQPQVLTPSRFVCYGVELPVVTRVSAATAAQPYIGLTLQLDTKLLADLVADMPPGEASEPLELPGVGTLTAEMSDAFARLLRLLDAPHDIAIMAPLITRELYYRLLCTPQGAALRAVIADDEPTRLVTEATHWLREHFAEPLDIASLSTMVSMSESSFYHHFRRVTSMSPLQYQKALRLAEARRLIYLGQANVATVARQVGYTSASQFSREYRRQSDVSPSADSA